FLFAVDRAQRELPADRRLGLAEMLAVPLGVLVQRATRTGREPGTIQEDARAVDEARAPVVLADRLPHTALETPFAELPLVVTELLGEPLDLPHVLLVGRMRSVRAATLDELGCRFGEHAGTALAEDAAVRRCEEGHIDLP